MMDKEQIIQLIDDAFKDVMRPLHNELFPDGWQTYDRLDEAIEDLLVDDWHGLSFAILKKYREAFGGLTPEWFVFLLPAFLIKTLEKPDEADILWETTKANITHPILWEEYYLEDERHFLAITELLNSAQCYALGQYLRYCVTRDPDEAIYDDNNIRGAVKYWDEKELQKRRFEQKP